jgi:hypothetical protein
VTTELAVWFVSLVSVFLVGWAWGRSGRRVVVVNFPERPALNALKLTAAEVSAAMRKSDVEETE